MILDHLSDTPLDSSDEAVQMAVTLAAAYFERGDTGQAVRVCRKAVTKAEKLESPTARASAYWNASMMEHAQGSVRDAIPLAERALQLLAEGQDVRNLARLRNQLQASCSCGWIRLRCWTKPRNTFRQAARGLEFEWCSAGSVEVARNELAQARRRTSSRETSEALR